jgi:hypothetical protein
MQTSGLRWAWALALVLVLAVLACTCRAQTDGERASKAGELVTINNMRVLRLFGNSVKERGFANGYYLAEEIRDNVDEAIKTLPYFNANKFDDTLSQWARESFVWDADATAEMDGIYEGMLAKLGQEGIKSPLLKRALARKDLNAINAIADRFGPACSGFTAAGACTAEGCVIHARSLDFPVGPKIIASQILIVCAALPERAKDQPARKAWVAVGWPGLIAQYTMMNADGFVAAIHDSYNFVEGGPDRGFIPRGVLLRRMAESVDPMLSDPAAQGEKICSEFPVACGNLFHISWPKAAAEKNHVTASAVLEIDASSKKVNVRRMDESGTLVVTNHFLLRNKPVACDRFKCITDGLKLLHDGHRLVGQVEARKLLMAAEQPVAAHSVYFYPDTRKFSVSLTRNNVMSPSVAPVAFDARELLDGKK